MFISREEILDTTGYVVEQKTLLVAQLMIETYVGKDEVEVEDAEDLAVLGRATTFQAIYLETNPQISMEQMAVMRETQGEATSVLDTEKFAPFLSPWAWKACQKLSWIGTRTVHTGPVFDRYQRSARWETT